MSHAPSAGPSFWRGLTTLLLQPFLYVVRLPFWCSGLERYVTEERRERGLCLVLPGIDGESVLNHSLVYGLADGGVASAIELVDWTTRRPWLAVYHLMAFRRNREVARRIALRIVEYQQKYPGRPVDIVGHSGGGAMAILIAESLPAEVRLRHIALVAPALSPRYDLSPALRHVSGMVTNFYSRGDFLFLGLYTLLLGSIDRRCGPCAGMIGFAPPPDPAPDTPSLYAARLRQRPWRLRDVLDLNFGGHVAVTNALFVARHVAPVVMQT